MLRLLKLLSNVNKTNNNFAQMHATATEALMLSE